MAQITFDLLNAWATVDNGRISWDIPSGSYQLVPRSLSSPNSKAYFRRLSVVFSGSTAGTTN